MTPPKVSPNATLTLKAAAAHAGVSVSTVRRRKDALLSAGAEVTKTGWSIPLSALNAVFMMTKATPSGTPVESDLIKQLRAENERLWNQVEQQAQTIKRQAEAHAVISAQLARISQLEAIKADPVSDDVKLSSWRKWWHRK